MSVFHNREMARNQNKHKGKTGIPVRDNRQLERLMSVQLEVVSVSMCVSVCVSQDFQRAPNLFAQLFHEVMKG